MKGYLCHYGVKGMHWGIRRYQPYPKGHTGGKFIGKQKLNTERILEKSKNYELTTDRPTTQKNVDKWGNSKDTNILWVTGISGSGKSTMAKKMADENDADLINIDTYMDKTVDKHKDTQSRDFNKYLDKNVPNWKYLQRRAYEVFAKSDNQDKKPAGLWFDTFEEALKGYGAQQYGKRKVVAEGVQILDETLFYNNKTSLKNQPIIIMDTFIDDAILSGMLRDNKGISKLLGQEHIKNVESWLNDVDYLRRAIK